MGNQAMEYFPVWVVVLPLLKSGMKYLRISRAESFPHRRRSTPSRAGFRRARADGEQNLWGGWFRAAG